MALAIEDKEKRSVNKRKKKVKRDKERRYELMMNYSKTKIC